MVFAWFLNATKKSFYFVLPNNLFLTVGSSHPEFKRYIGSIYELSCLYLRKLIYYATCRAPYEVRKVTCTYSEIQSLLTEFPESAHWPRSPLSKSDLCCLDLIFYFFLFFLFWCIWTPMIWSLFLLIIDCNYYL